MSCDRRLEPGHVLREGTEGAYHGLRVAEGDERELRLELVDGKIEPTLERSLLHFAHVTDLHLVEPGSPARYEFMEAFQGGPDILGIVLPAHRPQEALALHACHLMLRTLESARSPISGRTPEFLITTGDNTDNQQHNELERFLTLFGGGTVEPCVALRYEGVQAADWPERIYWQPDSTTDRYQEAWGFPRYPGILERAAQPFTSEGLTLPWLSCLGNHDSMILGTSPVNEIVEAMLRGDRKPFRAPSIEHLEEALERFVVEPESLLSGPTTVVTPEPRRATFSPSDYVSAHCRTPGQPQGHGFSAANAETGTNYYVFDASELVRLVVLDTNNRSGHFDGSIDRQQFGWLRDRLIESHRDHASDGGRRASTGHADRLVVICTHHGSRRLTNIRVGPEDSGPRVTRDELVNLLHAFPNVVLWINGHVHRNVIYGHRAPNGRPGGFWEVTTSSLMDWPCQARLIELTVNQDGHLSIYCTMVDHSAPVSPRDAEGQEELASLHRELAANDPNAGWSSGRAGTASDRTVQLVVPAPFELY